MNWTTWQRSKLGMAVLGTAALVVAGCDREPDPYPGDEWCQQAGYSIASRTFTCVEDADLANDRYERLMSEYDCLPDVTNAGPGCAERLLNLTCEQVAAMGDDLEQWLVVGQCAQLQKKAGEDGGTDG